MAMKPRVVRYLFNIVFPFIWGIGTARRFGAISRMKEIHSDIPPAIDSGSLRRGMAA